MFNPKSRQDDMAQNGARSISQSSNLANKIALRDFQNAIAASSKSDVLRALGEAYHEDAIWRGSHPLNEMQGPQAMAETVWQNLLHSFPDLERRDEIIVGGRYCDRHGAEKEMVACLGHYCATFRHDWLDIPATNQPVWLRYGEVHEMTEGRISRSTCLWDILDLIRQAGFWPLAPSRGTEGRWMGPITGDGLVFSEQDMEEGLGSIAQTLAMHKTLADYKDHEHKGRNGLLAMPQKQHWHEKMMWYGPSGIGTTRGLAGFVDFHQLPFRLAFPGRKGGQTLTRMDAYPDAGHYIQIGDGAYSVTGGWPSVVATHSGGTLFGTGPTGREVGMRVMDFYLHHEGRIRENWVPLDVIDLLNQMGVDVMARMREQAGRGAASRDA